MASYAIPALIAPSPITAITLLFLSFDNFLATAIPKVADIEVDPIYDKKGSYSLSVRLVKPDNPLPFLKVLVVLLFCQ